MRIRAVDEQGQPVAGATVEVKQTARAFPFGSAMGSVLLRNPEYQECFRTHFDWAMFENKSRWYSTHRRGYQDNQRLIHLGSCDSRLSTARATKSDDGIFVCIWR